jgi:thiol-disulfide isomerase/thioredoxin
MTTGAWVLVVAVVVALVLGLWRAMTDGTFRGTRQVREPRQVRDPRWSRRRAGAVSKPPDATPQPPVSESVLTGTAYDGLRGERATLLQFSSAFCAPCRATRRTLAEVASTVPGVAHVEVDAEEHLDLVRALGVLRTPTTLVLDEFGREVTRATGAPRPVQVLAALDRGVAS